LEIMAQLSLPQRLPRRADFLRLAAKGRKIPKPGVVMQALRVDSGEELRVGYTATKKLGNAVARNRTKRRLREAARLSLGARDLRGVELVLIGRQETAAMPFERLRASVDAALAEALK
jgi:ribonuclease P protein component